MDKEFLAAKITTLERQVMRVSIQLDDAKALVVQLESNKVEAERDLRKSRKELRESSPKLKDAVIPEAVEE
jgi:hypothetical protein